MKVSAIFSSDWHISSSVPVCRKDDYFKTQRKKIKFILNLAVKHKCPIFIAGDIGDKPQWKNWLLAKIITLGKVIPSEVKIYTIAGQHDLPYHNLDLIEESGLWVLNQAGFLRILNEPTNFGNFVVCPFHYGEEMIWHSHSSGIRTVALIHQLIIQKGSQEWEKESGYLANHLLREFPCYDLIVSGDNHIPFQIQKEDNILLNCGSLIREEISQIDHKPAVYLWNAEDNIIQKVFVPIEKDVFDTSLHSFKHEKEEIELFVKNLHSAEGFKLNFQSNMQRFFKRNAEKIKKSVKSKVLSTFDSE